MTVLAQLADALADVCAVRLRDTWPRWEPIIEAALLSFRHFTDKARVDDACGWGDIRRPPLAITWF